MACFDLVGVYWTCGLMNVEMRLVPNLTDKQQGNYNTENGSSRLKSWSLNFEFEGGRVEQYFM